MSQLQTQQFMTSQIRSQIYTIILLILCSKLMRNVNALAVFNTI